MALGTDMKTLVEDIMASRETREKALKDVRKDTHHILAEAKNMLKDFAKEDEERAEGVKKLGKEVKSFLTSSRENRKQDFGTTMKTVHARLEDVKKDSKHWRNAGKTVVKDAKDLLETIAKDNKKQAKDIHEDLKKAEHSRKADYKDTMEHIQEDLKEVKHEVSKVRKDASNMVSRYHNSRISAQKHWASLSAGRKKSKKHESEE